MVANSILQTAYVFINSPYAFLYTANVYFNKQLPLLNSRKAYLAKSNIKSENYIIKLKKFTNIVKLIKEINMKINNKIKLKVLNNKIEKKIKKKIDILPNWKQNFTIEKDLIKYLNENN